jgi:hypothetical protein
MAAPELVPGVPAIPSGAAKAGRGVCAARAATMAAANTNVFLPLVSFLLFLD